jgi:hypothetical protein
LLSLFTKKGDDKYNLGFSREIEETNNGINKYILLSAIDLIYVEICSF